MNEGRALSVVSVTPSSFIIESSKKPPQRFNPLDPAEEQQFFLWQFCFYFSVIFSDECFKKYD